MKSFVDERSMTLKQKIIILSFADFMLMFPLIKIDNIYMRVTLILLIAFKLYYFIFKIKTVRKVRN